MIDIQLEASELIAIMQELFPKEYTICIQKAQITKLEAMVEEARDKVNTI